MGAAGVREHRVRAAEQLYVGALHSGYRRVDGDPNAGHYRGAGVRLEGYAVGMGTVRE